GITSGTDSEGTGGPGDWGTEATKTGAVPRSPIPKSPEKSTNDQRQHDQGGARRGSFTGLGSHQEALGSDRRHGVPQHHRSAASRREDRAAGVRQFQPPTPRP